MFYDRLKSACNLRNIALNTVVRATLPSNGVVENWKKGGSPRADAVLKIAKYLNVSSDYLLGLTENPSPINKNARELDDIEAALVDRLRLSDSATRKTVLTMTFSVLPSMDENDFFSSSNDGICHQLEEEKSAKARKFRKRVEGEAAAGAPITAVPEDDLYIPVPEKYLNERYFIVRARGESMADRIPNGAFCVFLRDAPVDDGSTVLVQIDGQTDQPDGAIKRFYRMGREVELRSDNPAFPSMRYPAESVRVTGVLAAVIPHKGDV